ncbi:FMN reductase [NAD(P)H] [compost metagenome]
MIRPRLPREAVYHENKYDAGRQAEAIAAYDETVSEYMRERTGGKAATTWSEAMAAKRGSQRLHMRHFLRDQGFMLE